MGFSIGKMSSIFTGVGGHFERRDAINTFIIGEIWPACAKKKLTATTYYCQVEVKVRDRIAAVDDIFPSVS